MQIGTTLLRYAGLDARDRDAEQRTAADIAASYGATQLAEHLHAAEAKAAKRAKRCGTRWGMPVAMCVLLFAAHVWCSLLARPATRTRARPQAKHLPTAT